LATRAGWLSGSAEGKIKQYEEEQGMKKQRNKIEVRFFESAEFHITPTETWVDRDDCGQERE
jgi:hypothetical protein